jgi:hypothetical protein
MSPGHSPWPKFVARIDEIQDSRVAEVSYGVMWREKSMDVLLHGGRVGEAEPRQE